MEIYHLSFSRRRFDAALLQFLGNSVEGSPAKEEFVDELDHLRLFLVDFEILVIAEECAVSHTGFSLGELLPLAPCGVFRDAAALLLSEARHNRDKEFSARVERPDVLFLEVNLYAVFLEYLKLISSTASHQFSCSFWCLLY